MAHMYARSDGSIGIAVGKVFGRQYPGLMVSRIFFTPPSTPAGEQVYFDYYLSNRGDDAAVTPYVDFSLLPVAGGVPVSLGIDATPNVQPGQTIHRQLSLPVPVGTPSGMYRVLLVAKLPAYAQQYTDGANSGEADRLLTVTGLPRR